MKTATTTTHCTHTTPCPAHRAEALAAADAAEAAYRAAREHMPAKAVAQGAQGARAYAYEAALVRPTSPCSDGEACEVGWPSADSQESGDASIPTPTPSHPRVYWAPLAADGRCPRRRLSWNK